MTATAIPAAEPGSPAVPGAPVSFEQFLAWADEDVRAEWVDGEVVLMSPANLEHQDLLKFLDRLVTAFVEARRLGRVFFAPVLMRLPTRPSGREPDLLFVTNEHADRLHQTYVDGPADLVVEIVSPESDARDRGEKLVEYEAGGVPEYWLIDPLRRDALFYVLGADRRYRRVPPDADGWYRSAVLDGFRLQVAWLWERPLPPISEVIPQIVA